MTIVILPCKDRKIQDISDAEEDTEGEGDNFWYPLGFFLKIFLIFFLQAKEQLISTSSDVDKVDFDDPEDTKEVLEAEGDNFLNLFLQANVWLNTKQIIAKAKRVFLNMSKQ